ncbi:MAG: hydroxyacid dehydrogenase [Clostridiales bacterium]|jgi:phosphoglycerate dehydrogenase-like enzyme|nr:hydroxyacid dehydrogenase [Clostridiales bacterium]
MKAIFLQQPGYGYIDAVFGGVSAQRLREKLIFPPEYIHAGNLEAHRDFLKDAVFAFSSWGVPGLDEKALSKYLPQLKALFHGAGSVQFARPYFNRGVRVFSAWRANAVPVAEFAFAQILLAAKGYFQSVTKYRKGAGEAGSFAGAFKGNYGMTVGILGAGSIGKLVIDRLRTTDKTRVLVFDPFLPDAEAEQLGVIKCGLDEVFAEADTVSNHLADNPRTRGMIGYAQLSKMKPFTTFINTGRGAQVIEADLVRALTEDPSRTALLDVTESEPLPPESGLWGLDNVYLTPHIAGSKGLEVQRCGAYMTDECLAFMAGKPTRHEVSLSMLDTMA